MSSADDAVSDYLRRLERAAAVLPSDRRDDLLDGIREHIAAARAAGAAADEAAVRTLLDRLGEPEEIVAAAREDEAPPVGVATRPVGTGLELAAVLMLTAGSFLPVVGWLVGVVLLWTSRLWRTREKLLGTVVVPLGPGGVLVLGGLLPFSAGESCTSTVDVGSGVESVVCTGSSGPPGWLTATVLVALLVLPVVVAVLLLRTARRRAAQRPEAVSAAERSPWGALEVAGVLVLGLGGLLVPLLGPLVGMALVLASPRWTGGQKTVAGLLALVPVLVPVSALLIARVSL